MSVLRGIVVVVIGVLLMIAVTACRPALANDGAVVADNQTLATASEAASHQPSGEVVWAKIPYCQCLSGSATANVAAALEQEKLNVSLKEQSPRDGWLYFVVTFDPTTATLEQVSAAIVAGGGELVDGPP